MAAGLMVSVEEYLRTTYRPDCDFVDGEVVARNMGERPHSITQRRVITSLIRRYPHLEDQILPEQRVQVTVTRFRIPDVCMLRDDSPEEPIVRTAPLLCIEVLSKDDSLRDMTQRIDEYLNMGVAACWIVDPLDRQAWIATRPGELIRAHDGVLRAPGVEMPISEVLP